MSDRVRAVVFDWYGTLGRPMPDDWWPRVGELIASAGGAAATAALENWVSVPLEHVAHSASREHYERWSAERLQALLTSCGLDPAATDRIVAVIEDARAREIIALADDAAAVIDELHDRGMLVGLCSNWDWDLDRQLAHNDITERFDAVACSARVGYRKPHERIFAQVLAALGTAAPETVFVGDDWSADVEGALAMGMTAVHAGWAVSCHVEDHEGVACISRLTELLQLPGLAGAAGLV